MIKNITIIVVLIIILFFGFNKFTKEPVIDSPEESVEIVVDTNEVENTETLEVDLTEEPVLENKTKTVIGTSVNGDDITAYHFGSGEKNLLFVSGIHGGYDSNTTSLSNKVIDYLKENPETIPENVRVSIVPVLNIDGANNESEASKISGGRFNANGVDLNRNFACDWQEKATWQNKTVSGGNSAFSEPETKALKSFVETLNPESVVVWYSAAGGVYSSNCHNGVLAETAELTRVFAKASGYPGNEDFDFYEITGDATNWLANEGIPAISVLLTNHEDIEVDKNLKGIKAVLNYYAE